MSILKHITIPRIIGAASVVIIGSDAIKYGNRKGNLITQRKEADSTTDTIFLNQKMDSNSYFINSMKKKYLEFSLDNNLFKWVKSTKNKVSATFGEFFSNILNVSLAVGAIAMPTKYKVTKWIARGCAALLGLQGAKVIFSDIVGMGKDNPLK